MSLVGEIPWICLFLCVLALVQLQFRFCVPCMLGGLKVLQTTAIILLFRVWVMRDQWAAPDAADFATYAQNIAAAFRNHTEF